MKDYLKNVAFSTSRLVNTIFGGNPDYTFAVEQYMRKRQGDFNVVFLIDLPFTIAEVLTNFVLTKLLKKRTMVTYSDHCLHAWSDYTTRNAKK